VWAPDGSRLVFTSFETGVGYLSWRASDGGTPVETLSAGPTSRYATTISPDGSTLVFREEGRPTGLDLFVLPLDGDSRPRPLIESQYNELNAEISPDGRWLAYKSNETGRDEVFVRPYPDVDGGRWQISTDGGVQPAWAPNGRELFYRAPDGALMQVPIQLQPGFSTGTPRMLLEPGYLLGGPGRAYDISPDGERFLMITADESRAAGAPPSIVVVRNWFEELKRLVPPP
jgi:serine/threonine-protein kinase